MDTHLDIEQLNEAYLKSKEAFQQLVDGHDIGVGVYNSNASPLICNQAAYDLLGLSKEQFMGNSAMDPYWKVTHEDGRKFEQYDFPIIDVITNYKEKKGVIMGVSRPLKNDKVWLEVNAHPILDGATIDYVICTYKNVSEQFLDPM
ncbi:PAS domain-containing protein [Ekhidna sp. To15]|uniref:PAS domain-containing protein n=1 Tax=Ekhidna sp. To15 TaxID=3395267 RepID=UPI003F51BAA6